MMTNLKNISPFRSPYHGSHFVMDERVGGYFLVMGKNSFLLYKDSLAVLSEMTDEQAGKLFKAIAAAQMGLNVELDLLTRIAFAPFKAQFDRDLEAYEKTVERNKSNGYKGGRPKTQPNPTEPNETQKTQVVSEKPKKADSDSDSDSDSDKDKKNRKKRSRRVFIPPTISEVEKYFAAKGFRNELAKQAFEYYSAGEWKDRNGNQVLNWKQKMISVWMTDENRKQFALQKEGENTKTKYGEHKEYHPNPQTIDGYNANYHAHERFSAKIVDGRWVYGSMTQG